MNKQAEETLRRLLGVEIDVSKSLDSYTVAIQQMVAIARALYMTSTKILILDEPTSSLDVNETNQLFKVMRKLKGEGVGIIFITHFIGQIFEISDRTTVLRNGKLVGTYDTANLTRVDLISKMIGRSLAELDEMTKIKSETRKHIERAPFCKRKSWGSRIPSAPSTSPCTPAKWLVWRGCLVPAAPKQLHPLWRGKT